MVFFFELAFSLMVHINVIIVYTPPFLITWLVNQSRINCKECNTKLGCWIYLLVLTFHLCWVRLSCVLLQSCHATSHPSL